MQTSIDPSATSTPAITSADDIASYRTVSILSIVSLVLGLAAPLALLAPLLFTIPITGAAVAWLAIRRIAASDGALMGRTSAMLGLALSIAGISAAFTRTTLSRELLSWQARAAAREWFALLQAGDAKQAFQLTTDSRQNPPPMPPGGTPTGETAAETSPLEAFRANPVVHFLLDLAKEVTVEYVRDSAFDAVSPGNERIQQLYTVHVPSNSNAASAKSVELTLQRVRGFNGAPSQWLISYSQSNDLVSKSEERGPSTAHVP